MAKTTVKKKKAPVKKSKKVVAGSGISSYKRVNRKVIIVIAAVFAIIGLITLIRSFAAVPTQKFEAESFTFNMNQNDIAPEGRPYAAMWWTSTGTKSVLLDRDYQQLVVRARGSSCYGAPRMQVKIDQAIVLDQYITATDFTDIPVNINAKGGNHVLEISFLNDFGSGKIGKIPACDRNLYVDSMTFIGTNIIEPSTTVSDSVISTVTPAGFQYGSYGQALTDGRGMLWSNGTISASATTTRDATSTVLYLSADLCNGEPTIKASINGTTVMEGAIGEQKVAAYVIPKTIAAGTQNIQLSFLNDTGTSTCNRNIYVHKVEFRGYVPPVQPAPPRAENTPCIADLIFCEDFEQYRLKTSVPAGSLTGTAYATNWLNNQSCPDRVTIESDPVSGIGKSAKMTVHNTDVKGKTGCPAAPNENPRAQLLSKQLFKEGDDVYISVGTYFPSDFPRDIGLKSYLQITQIYGGPSKCGPPIGIFVVGTKFQLNQVNAVQDTSNCTGVTRTTAAWKSNSDILYGTAWNKIVMRVKFSTNPSTGFIEIWQNGKKQKFNGAANQKLNGGTISGDQERYYTAALVSGVNYTAGGATNLHVNSYRGATAYDGYLTLWHDSVKVGKTYESVQ